MNFNRRHVLVGLFALGVLATAGYTLSLSQVPDLPADLNSGVPGVVKVVEYSDFKCPYCSRAAATVEVIRNNYGDRVDLEFRHFPLNFHKGADLAAEAAECARDQGKFWEFHDEVFGLSSRGVDVGEKGLLKGVGEKLGLDAASFNQCLDSGSKRMLVKQHVKQGESLGVTGTPTFFIEGQMLVGAKPYEEIAKLIDEKMEAA